MQAPRLMLSPEQITWVIRFRDVLKEYVTSAAHVRLAYNDAKHASSIERTALLDDYKNAALRHQEIENRLLSLDVVSLPPNFYLMYDDPFVMAIPTEENGE